MAQLWAGMVVAGYGGFYQVQIADGAVIICRARGRLKQQYAGIYVGDQVEISIISGTDGVLENILPRKNQLLRPKIANVSQAVLVQAAREPAYDLYLLDKMLVVAGLQGIKPLICFNKADLAAPGELEQIAAVYRCAGYVCCGVSALSGAGIADLLCYFGEGITVLAGPSGVGKSSLLNQLVPGMTAKTGEISVRLQRGK
ncbi:MAG: ribosome small subunit-dependent GTPase A, partial [Clostridiales bacterium]